MRKIKGPAKSGMQELMMPKAIIDAAEGHTPHAKHQKQRSRLRSGVTYLAL